MLETHLAGKTSEKRENPSTLPADAEHIHFMLNGKIRRDPGLAAAGDQPPAACAQMAWEDMDKVSLAVPWYSHRQLWARAA
jgi:hypothetical protein